MLKTNRGDGDEGQIEQDEGQPLMKDLVLLLCWLYRGCADACFEHVVVAAAHYDRTNASLVLMLKVHAWLNLVILTFSVRPLSILNYQHG